MGTQMLVIMLAFTFGGYQIDHYLGYKVPVFTVSLSLLGIFSALYLTLKDLLHTGKKK
ncbi:MAG: AtpZ/AtpI family protein [Bacteroidota bacterium]